MQKLKCLVWVYSPRWAGYSSFKCPTCGQEYVYDNDVYRIELTQRQIELLRRKTIIRNSIIYERIK